MKLILGDSLEILKKATENSIDSIVCDPPYELGFMGKSWDATGIAYNVELWKGAMRVLKPGGHLLAFGGSRTYHRLAVAIEDAGFTIRDQMMWIYGSGFPKGHNLKDEWKGWGTSLKPSHEPIVLARKPLSEKTVTANVKRWGTGAINIDECRIPGEVPSTIQGQSKSQQKGDIYSGRDQRDRKVFVGSENGRFPANTLLDEEAGGMLGEPSRFFYCAKASKKERGDGNTHPTVKPRELMRYLCGLVTPPKGTILDPFMGSGSTGVVARMEGFDFVGIEKDSEYFAIAENRLKEMEGK